MKRKGKKIDYKILASFKYIRNMLITKIVSIMAAVITITTLFLYDANNPELLSDNYAHGFISALLYCVLMYILVLMFLDERPGTYADLYYKYRDEFPDIQKQLYKK